MPFSPSLAPAFFHLEPPPFTLPTPILHEPRSIFVQSADTLAPSSPCSPPSLIPLYRWTTVTDDLTIANPCRHPLLICSEFLTASPLETVAKKPPSHFIPSPALPIVLLSSSFARTAMSSTSSSSSLFHLPSTCNLVGTHVTMWWKILKIGHPSARCSPLISTFRLWLTYGEQKKMRILGWISATMIAMPWFRGKGVDLSKKNEWSNSLDG